MKVTKSDSLRQIGFRHYHETKRGRAPVNSNLSGRLILKPQKTKKVSQSITNL